MRSGHRKLTWKALVLAVLWKRRSRSWCCDVRTREKKNQVLIGWEERLRLALIVLQSAFPPHCWPWTQVLVSKPSCHHMTLPHRPCVKPTYTLLNAFQSALCICVFFQPADSICLLTVWRGPSLLFLTAFPLLPLSVFYFFLVLVSNCGWRPTGNPQWNPLTLAIFRTSRTITFFLTHLLLLFPSVQEAWDGKNAILAPCIKCWAPCAYCSSKYPQQCWKMQPECSRTFSPPGMSCITSSPFIWWIRWTWQLSANQPISKRVCNRILTVFFLYPFQLSVQNKTLERTSRNLWKSQDKQFVSLRVFCVGYKSTSVAASIAVLGACSFSQRFEKEIGICIQRASVAEPEFKFPDSYEIPWIALGLQS